MLRLTLFLRLRVQLRERAKLVLVVVLVVGAKTLYLQSGALQKDIAALEIVQRRGFRFALGTNADRMSYEDRVKRLKWPTLEKRRTFSSLTECYKTVNGLNGISPLDFFNFADKYRTLRSNHRCKLKTIPAQLNCYKHSFFIRILHSWNNLSAGRRPLKQKT